MTAKVLEGAGGKVAEQWISSLLTSAIVFWAGGLVAVIQRFGWQPFTDWFTKQPEPLQLALLVAVLGGAIASAAVVERFQLMALRGLEGYWHPIFTGFKDHFIRQQIKVKGKLESQFQDLDNRPRLTSRDRQLRVKLDRQLSDFPVQDIDVMPTPLGNILRAAELRSLDKYGLDAVICWPRLWLLLPESAKADLQAARAELNATARLWIWSWLFFIWAFWAWWAALIALFSICFAYHWAIAAAKTYGDLIEASFDLYRGLLYEALRLPFPKQADQEPAAGRMLTQYLWRGTLPESYQFIATSEISPVIDQ
ncbi:hypothetical protein H6F46_08615 [Limnothrix sp. FACHB-1083]|uniref:hypothetical protein n=1 Tax=unclassified Limnothrix TaxID=2632864 RepID=UPI001681697E|nr:MULTISPECIES: hypothetical protein [unclassified Limnothrix]MBD2160756.1 hypothetical protein [Limnothrix sp. FACHB-1083]MBD2191401.1 hypothetical protein [Limnothrix sp. FACHB-1088]